MVKITVHDAEHWITVHPNGNKEEKGTPLLIEGSNGHYVVKGGAGGKLNGKTVNPKSMSKARKGTEGSNGGGEPAPEKQPVGVPEGSASQPHEAPKEHSAPESKKTEVTITKEGDKYWSPAYMNLKIGGKDVRLSLTPASLENGVAEYIKDWLEKNADRFENGGYGLSLAGQSKDIETAKQVLKEYELRQIVQYGDQRLPESEREASKNEAAKEIEKIKKAEEESAKASVNAALSRLQQKRDKREADLAKRRAITNRAPFAPAKTVKEAKKWAEDNNLADHVDFGKLNVFVANAMNKSLSQHLELFPKLRNEVVAIGSGRAVMGFAHEYAKEKYVERMAAHYGEEAESRADRHVKKESTPRNCWAFAAPNRFGSASGVGFNESSGSDIDRLQEGLNRSVQSGFHPVGCDTVKSIMDHELGHSLDFMLGLSRDSEVIAIRHKAQYELGGIEKAVSEYAKKNMAEFIAESWSEYLNNPSPRPTALALGLLVRKRYAEKFGA